MYIRPLKFSYFCFATLHLLSFFGIRLVLILIFSSDYHPSPFFTSSLYKSYTYGENLGCYIERHCKDPSTSNGIFSLSVGVWPRQMTRGWLISIGWLSRATSSTPLFRGGGIVCISHVREIFPSQTVGPQSRESVLPYPDCHLEIGIQLCLQLFKFNLARPGSRPYHLHIRVG